MTEGFDLRRRQDRARLREMQIAELQDMISHSDDKMQDVLSQMLTGLEDEHAKANREDAEESARRADEIATYTMLLAKDARNAWDSGSSYYLPAMPLTYEADDVISRAVDAEAALTAIGGAGWKLHTWTVDGGRARPLFTRD